MDRESCSTLAGGPWHVTKWSSGGDAATEGRLLNWLSGKRRDVRTLRAILAQLDPSRVKFIR